MSIFPIGGSRRKVDAPNKPTGYVPKDLPDSERENVPVFTGKGYETYGNVKRRGWRYTPGDQHLPLDNDETSTNQKMQTNINPASKKKIYVRVRRNDDVEMTMPYRAFTNVRNSVNEQTGTKTVTLLSQCEENGTPIAGGPDLEEVDRQTVVE